LKTLYKTSDSTIRHADREKWLVRRKQRQKAKAEKKFLLRKGVRMSKVDMALWVFEQMLKGLGLYKRGVRNALNTQVRHMTLAFERLPPALDGLTVLQVSDLHLDALPGLSARIAKQVAEIPCDICVLTGDYRKATYGSYGQVLPMLHEIVKAVRARYGVWGVLGNHDPGEILFDLEKMGVNMLLNEYRMLEVNGCSLLIAGTDDTHYYPDPAQEQSLIESPEADFKMAFIHTPELYREAAVSGFDLYLCGHTHGGQIALPNGKPIITHSRAPHPMNNGLWQYQGMTGYTTTGVGVSGIPVRYNTQGELVKFTLKSASKNGKAGA